MDLISFKQVTSKDELLIEQIAQWYLEEWNIDKTTTIKKLTTLPDNGIPQQFVLYNNNIAVATGGIYSHVSLLDHDPRFKIHTPWLALVYTSSDSRNKGFGKTLCEQIQISSKKAGLQELFLFTHTAESLYKKLGWQEIERIYLKEKHIVVMKKVL